MIKPLKFIAGLLLSQSAIANSGGKSDNSDNEGDKIRLDQDNMLLPIHLDKASGDS